MVRNVWKLAGLGVLALMLSGSAMAEESVGFWAVAKEAGFMAYVLLAVSIAGVALGLQAFVQIKPHLLRPPSLANELLALVQEGNLDEAADAAQANGDTFLGAVASAALFNAQNGREAMESAASDAGEIEASKFLNRIGVLSMIAAVAPMLGLTGTTIGMIMTFAMIAAKADAVTASDMARGISEALVCTFVGLMVAIPLIALSFFLKAKLMQTIYEISNDVNELIRTVHGGEQPAK